MTRVVLAAHDPAWASSYASHRKRLRAALGERATIEHIGSTAVPDLAAKPVVDILIAGVCPNDEQTRIVLARAGYDVVVDETGHRMYAPPERDAHVHLWEHAKDIERHLVFRDWLCAHPEDRQLYEHVKRRLALRLWEDINDYAQAKNAVIETILRRARGAAAAGPRIDVFARLLLEVLPARADVLEIGAGEGVLAAKLLQAGHRVVALDRELRSTFPIVLGVFEEYVASPASFDCVAAQLVLHHVGDLQVTLEKIAMLLEPHGIVAIDDYGWERSDDPAFREDRKGLHSSQVMLEALRRHFDEVYYGDRAYLEDGAGDDALAFTFVGRRRM